MKNLKFLCLTFFPPDLQQDHIEKENTEVSSLKFHVLNEADEMLRMGFVEDVELILGMWILFYLLPLKE